MEQDPESLSAHPEIPDQLFFKMGEVARIVGVEPYVLRFWETKFPTLSPRKLPGGHRQYRRKDVELLLTIKTLLRVDGHTIKGARKALRRRGQGPGPDSGKRLVSVDSLPPGGIDEIKAELRQILELLDA